MISDLDFIVAMRNAHEQSMGEYTLEEIFDMLADGSAQAWNVDKLYAITSINRYAYGKVCCIWLMGGRMEQSALEKGLEMISAFAKHNACKYIEVMGRKGWVKKLAPLGFTESYTVVHKPLGDL